VGAKQGQRKKSAGRQRLGLVVFGVLFVVLFAIFAVAQGIGAPSVPSGDVAIVQSMPEGEGMVSEKELARAMVQAATQSGLKAAPKPGDAKYEEVKSAALGELLDAIWIQGQGEEMGIEVTPKQVATELEQIKKQNFKTEAAFQKFLKESHFTKEDVDKRVKLQVLSTQIQQRLTNGAVPATEAEVEDYYNAAKSTQFTQPPSRDIRAIVNKDPKKVEEAQAALEKDDSAKNWKVVAKKFSEDPFTKTTGGLQAGVTAESGRFPKEVEGAMFKAALVKIEGPVKAPTGIYVFEVEKTTPEKVQTLKEVKSQISTQLTQQVQQENFSEFIASYQDRWQSRTFCASGLTEGIENVQARDELAKRCANVSPSGRSSTAPPACYEADPKGGRPADCPAPVLANSPALPGSTTILAPQGERLPQRPRPEGLEEKEGAEAAAGGLESVVPGATEAPPPEG
jgi:parvulin-like peptidyl-prolyl isomerase